MNDSLLSLRLRLKTAFNALHSVTIADLQDLKWPLRQQIFLNIFSNATLLADPYETMLTLQEKRDAQFARWKSSGATIRLERIRWPPSLEAFSDPMNDLLHAKDVIYDAIDFLLNVLYPMNLPSTPGNRTTPTKSNLETPKDGGKLSSQSPLALKSPPSPEKSTISKSYGKMDVFTGDQQNSQHHLSNMPDLSLSSLNIEMGSISQRAPLHTLPSQAIVAPVQDERLVDLLMYQNQILTSQLYDLKSSVAKREQVESTLAALMQDINRCLLEIVDVAQATTHADINTSDGEASIDDKKSSRKESHGGVCGECGQMLHSNPSTAASASKRVTNSSGDGNSSANGKSTNRTGTTGRKSTGLPPFSWRGVAAKLKQLEGQWTEATRAARQMATRSSNGYGTINKNSNSARVGSFGPPTTGRSPQSAASGNMTGRSAVGRSMAEKARQWVSGATVGNEQTQHMMPYSGRQNSDHDDYDDTSIRTQQLLQSDVLQHELLTLLTTIERWEESLIAEDSAESRSLLESANPTSAHRNSSNTMNSSRHTTQPPPSSARSTSSAFSTAGAAIAPSQRKRAWLDRYELQQQLKTSAQRILALSASQAGTVSVGNMQAASSKGMSESAVMRLIRKIDEELRPKLKKSSALDQEITSLCDNAMLEHVVLSRMVLSQRREQKRWVGGETGGFIRGLVDKLMVFGRSARKALEESCQKIVVLSGILRDITRVYHTAEDARISQKVVLQGLGGDNDGSTSRLSLGGMQSGMSTARSTSSKRGGRNGVPSTASESFSAGIADTSPLEADINSDRFETQSVRSTASAGSRRSSSGSVGAQTTLVSPMNALCRGVAGEEVAALIQLLRMHHATFQQLDEEMQGMVSQFAKSMTWEQQGMMEYLKVSLGQKIVNEATSVGDEPSLVGNNSSMRRSPATGGASSRRATTKTATSSIDREEAFAVGVSGFSSSTSSVLQPSQMQRGASKSRITSSETASGGTRRPPSDR